VKKENRRESRRLLRRVRMGRRRRRWEADERGIRGGGEK
jgi:hypothetical protein